LLTEWCRAQGCLHLLTAHHREDQAETYLIRKRADSGIDGLAGMSALRELAGVRLVRPLLAVPKARLAALIDTERQPFLSDPSNRNPLFERARLRRDSAVTDIERAAAEVRDYGRQRIARERQLDRLLASAVTLHPAGFAAIDPAAIEHAEAELGDRLLGRVALCIGGAAYPLRRERVSRLRAGLVGCSGRARTLGGCRFIPWRGLLLVIRELSRAASPARLIAGTELFWDRRFGVTAPPYGASKLMLGYLGQSEMRPAADGRDGELPRLVHPVLPALWDETGLIAVPHLGYFRAGVTDLPRIAFHPVNRLSHAGFTVV
jgi:tRNA(Ile)-lysidine synthase